MFSIKTLWQEARGKELHKEFMDLIRRHVPGLNEAQAEHYGRTLIYLSNNWTVQFTTPIEETPIETRKMGAKEFKRMAKERYFIDIGEAYGMALFSMHLEASYLPGEEAGEVYQISKTAIALAKETSSKLDGDKSGP